MNSWKVILATLVIFGAGVVTGGLLVSYSDRVKPVNIPATPPQNFRPPGYTNPGMAMTPGELRQPVPLPNMIQNRLQRGVSLEFLKKLDSEIHLTQGQRERIEQIIREGQARNREIWERITPELRREMTETQKRIRDALLPEQRARFEELMRQSRPPGRREEPLPPGNRPRDQRRPLPPADGPQPRSP